MISSKTPKIEWMRSDLAFEITWTLVLSKTCFKTCVNMRRSRLHRQLWVYVFNFKKPEHTTKFQKNMIIWSFWKPSHLFSVVRGHLGLKVRTFFNSPGNVDFENDLIFNPSFNIHWEKAKIVKTMTCMVTSYISWNLKFDANIQVILFTVLAFPEQIFD